MYVIYLVLWQVFNLKHHLVSNNQYISCQTIHIHVYFIRSWKHVMFSSFCNSILCYFIQSESSLKRYFWDNPCEVNQQFFPCPISSDHLKEKKLLTEFYMNFTDKISVIKKKTVMSAKVLVKRSENQITGTYTTGVWKKNCRYLILWSLDQ